MRLNTSGVFLMSTAVVRHLLERRTPGRIINIASGADRRGSNPVGGARLAGQLQTTSR